MQEAMTIATSAVERSTNEQTRLDTEGPLKFLEIMERFSSSTARLYGMVTCSTEFVVAM